MAEWRRQIDSNITSNETIWCALCSVWNHSPHFHQQLAQAHDDRVHRSNSVIWPSDDVCTWKSASHYQEMFLRLHAISQPWVERRVREHGRARWVCGVVPRPWQHVWHVKEVDRWYARVKTDPDTWHRYTRRREVPESVSQLEHDLSVPTNDRRTPGPSRKARHRDQRITRAENEKCHQRDQPSAAKRWSKVPYWIQNNKQRPQEVIKTVQSTNGSAV